MENSNSEVSTIKCEVIRMRDLPIKSWWSSFLKYYSKFNFISMAIFTTLFFLFIKKPFGAIIGNTLIVVWFCLHFAIIKQICQKFTRRAKHFTNERVPVESIWFLNEGKNKITETMNILSCQKISYCNLADYIEMPPRDSWKNIEYSLNNEGVKTEITETAFYIQWQLV